MVTYKGQEYPSWKACCDAYGISHHSVNHYKGRNRCSWEEAIEYILKAHKMPAIYNGVEYPSWRVCCETLGLNYSSIRESKSRNGWSWEEAIDKRPSRKVIYGEKSYPSWYSCCTQLGVKYDSVKKYRYKMKCAWATAIDHYIALEPKQGFTYDGKTYPSLKLCCAELGISYSSVFYYRGKVGCTTEEAITHYLKPANIKFLYNGRTTGKAYYSGICRTCKRKLLLTEDEVQNFTHSDEFCKDHLLPWGKESHR